MISCRHLLLLFCLLLLCGIACADEVASKGDIAPDGVTDCKHTFNLQEENRIQIAAPTVVDIDESTGNLLVRGPVPVIVRDGAGNQDNCKDNTSWSFATEELNEMLRHDSTFAPLYLSDSKKAALAKELSGFNISDYKVIDISLLNHGDSNTLFFAAESRAFGGISTTCSAPLVTAPFNGGAGSLAWVNTLGCAGSDASCTRDRLYTDNDGFCSYANTVNNLSALLATKDPDGRKRLIYYHCNHGADRTGGVTIGYLIRANPSMTVADAVTYTQYLGEERADNSRMPDNGWPANDQLTALATEFCKAISPGNTDRCSTKEDTRVYLPGSDTHSHLPDQDAAPATAVPTATPVPAQTPIPSTRYNPTQSGQNF